MLALRKGFLSLAKLLLVSILQYILNRFYLKVFFLFEFEYSILQESVEL